MIANLGVYFAIHTLFSQTRDVAWGALALLAAVLLFRLRWSVLRTLGVCALLGLAAGLAGLPVG